MLRHYDAKYADDATSAPEALVLPTPTPLDRFEACVSDLPGRLTGGHVLEIGAGNGRLTRSLLAAGLRCDSYTATELSDVRLGALRRCVGDPRVRVAHLDIEQDGRRVAPTTPSCCSR